MSGLSDAIANMQQKSSQLLNDTQKGLESDLKKINESTKNGLQASENTIRSGIDGLQSSLREGQQKIEAQQNEIASSMTSQWEELAQLQPEAISKIKKAWSEAYRDQSIALEEIRERTEGQIKHQIETQSTALKWAGRLMVILVLTGATLAAAAYGAAWWFGKQAIEAQEQMIQAETLETATCTYRGKERRCFRVYNGTPRIFKNPNGATGFYVIPKGE